MAQDASDIIGAITDRKPWTTPMVIVSEMGTTTEKKGTALVEGTSTFGYTYGSYLVMGICPPVYS